jgi:flavin reductase
MQCSLADVASLASVSPVDFKAVMRRFASTVNVITSGRGAAANGMTATAVCGVSADPPSILIVVNSENRTHALIERAGAYAVNVLSSEQQSLAIHFASRPAAPFATVAHRNGITGCPVLEGCDANIECVVESQIRFGTHSIFIGRVVGSSEFGRSLLVYQNGNYVPMKS